MSAASSTPASPAALANKFLMAGIAGLVLTVIGLFVDAHGAALSYVVGISYWTAIAIGMLMLVMIHHIFDAGWSTVIRRQFDRFAAVCLFGVNVGRSTAQGQCKHQAMAHSASLLGTAVSAVRLGDCR